jgi:hypothetical protein
MQGSFQVHRKCGVLDAWQLPSAQKMWGVGCMAAVERPVKSFELCVCMRVSQRCECIGESARDEWVRVMDENGCKVVWNTINEIEIGICVKICMSASVRCVCML